jgi:hypothetical protein
MLRKAGFSLVKEYGSFTFDLWTPESAHWLVEAVKNRSTLLSMLPDENRGNFAEKRKAL